MLDRYLQIHSQLLRQLYLYNRIYILLHFIKYAYNIWWPCDSCWKVNVLTTCNLRLFVCNATKLSSRTQINAFHNNIITKAWHGLQLIRVISWLIFCGLFLGVRSFRFWKQSRVKTLPEAKGTHTAASMTRSVKQLVGNKVGKNALWSCYQNLTFPLHCRKILSRAMLLFSIGVGDVHFS